VSSVCFSSDGRLLATAGTGAPARVWEVDSGGEVTEIGSERDAPWSVAFASDSRTVVVTGRSVGPSCVFDLAAGIDLLRLPGGGYCVTPDGRVACIEGASIALHELKRPVLDGDQAALWEDLMGKDARRAYRAVWSLGAAKDGATFLRDRVLGACEAKEDAAVRALVEDLDAERVETRTKAFKSLSSYGEEILPFLRKIRDAALSAEARARVDMLLDQCAASKSPRLLARLRAIQALELAGATEVLRELSERVPTQVERRRIRRALERLVKHR